MATCSSRCSTCLHCFSAVMKLYEHTVNKNVICAKWHAETEFNNNAASFKRSPALLHRKYLWLSMNIMYSSLLTHPVFSSLIFLTRSILSLHTQTHTASKPGLFWKIYRNIIIWKCQIISASLNHFLSFDRSRRPSTNAYRYFWKCSRLYTIEKNVHTSSMFGNTPFLSTEKHKPIWNCSHERTNPGILYHK